MKPKIDIISQICTAVDYPLFWATLTKYRSKFNKIILYGSKHHGVLTLEDYLKKNFPETWIKTDIDWTIPGIDWRQAETEPCLELSDAEWILFLEQDFFCDDWNKLWTDVEKAMETSDMIGWWNPTNFPYIHPCFLLMKRELLNRTKKDFSAHPEINGGDHFAMITHDVQELGVKIIKLQDLGWIDPEHAFHLGGLTYPYQNFKEDETIIGVKYPEALATYNAMIKSGNPEFQKLSEDLHRVLVKKGIYYNSKWEKFFKI